MLTFENLALACLARSTVQPDDEDGEADALRAILHGCVGEGTFSDALERMKQSAVKQDQRLLSLQTTLGLSDVELAAVALCVGVETSIMTGRLITWAQRPAGGSRPLLGLLAMVLREMKDDDDLTVFSLVSGAAFAAGVLTSVSDAEPLPERAAQVPLPLAHAIAGHASAWPNERIAKADGAVPWTALPASFIETAERHARVLKTAKEMPTLVIRASSSAEAELAAATVIQAMGADACSPCFMATDAPMRGLSAWLGLRRKVPVFTLDIAPGESKAAPTIAAYSGPVIVIAGLEGRVDAQHTRQVEWSVSIPAVPEREKLWSALMPAASHPNRARAHRIGVERTMQIVRQAQLHAQLHGRTSANDDDVDEVMRAGDSRSLGALAHLVSGVVPDKAFVRSQELGAALGTLLARCRLRDGLADKLGPAAHARYSPGVRALFTGPSGTGKTLAASWLATQLGLPLYRVDLAAVSSKYIGETERNLAQLFAAAEHTSAVLLFDEADSLFAKRTDIRDSTDRFANAQTNYLLQRIETFDGIAVLTSNNRTHFDTAFTRRLDSIIDFPAPGHRERVSLWSAHVADGLSDHELDFLAQRADFTGGQIRNAVLTAAVTAGAQGTAFSFLHLLKALMAEYRKAGRNVPAEIAARAQSLEGQA